MAQERLRIVRAAPPSLPEGPAEGPATSVRDAEYVGATELNGSAPLSNGRSNGTAPGSAAGSEAAIAASSATHIAEGTSQGFIAHRWRIVLMMAMAFVLCNMDKVSRGSRLSAPERVTPTLVAARLLIWHK